MRLRDVNRFLSEAVELSEVRLYNFNGKLLSPEAFSKLVVAKMKDRKWHYAIMNWAKPGLPKDIFDIDRDEYKQLKVKEVSFEKAKKLRRAQ